MASEFVCSLLSGNGHRSASQHSSVFGSQAASAHEQNRRVVLDHGEEAVTNDLQQLVQQLSPQAPKVLKVILLATRTSMLSASIAPTDAAACASLRSALFKQLPSWVHSLPHEEQSLPSDLTSAFLPELDQQQTADVTALMYACLAALEDAKPHSITLLQLVPPCLAAITAAPAHDTVQDATTVQAAADNDAAADTAGAAEMGADGAFCRDAVLSRLLACEWKQEDLGQLLTVLRDLPLTQLQLFKAIKKTVSTCRKAALQQLPPILYQLLLLSSGGARQLALTSLQKLFAYLEQQPANQAPSLNSAAAATAGSDATPSATLLQVEATLLMHISTLLKYDAALGNEWLKLFKSRGVDGDHIMLQVLLTMSCHHKLEQAVQQLLKKAVQQACEDEAMQASGGSSRWLSALPTVGRGATLQDLRRGLLKAIRCSSYASELVCPGLLQLAASLLTTPCSCPLHVVMAARAGKAATLPAEASAGARAVGLGLLLLQELFEVHAEARTEVLKVAQAQLSCSNLDAALPHVLLLSSICRTQPALVSSYVQQLKECLSSFAGLSADAALVLLLALWPLCRVRTDLQDHVIMLLRKMMYRQDVGGRLVAIRGFLCLILQHLADAAQTGAAAAVMSGSEASCSQASLSQVSSLTGSRGINLLQELAAVLRRALSQQAPVREALYKGLLQVFDADPGAHELLCELLLPHLTSFMPENRNDLPPLLLHGCADIVHGEAVLQEPLPALLRCVHRLAAADVASDTSSHHWAGPTDQHSSTKLRACFASLRSNLARCQLDHFDLGDAGNLNPAQPEGMLQQMHAANLIGALQVVMEDVVQDIRKLQADQPDANTRDAAKVAALGEELAKLFQLHSQVYNLALEGSRGPSKSGAKKGRKAAGSGMASDAGGEPQATAGQKRSKPSSTFTAVTRQPPHMSASCLAALCMAIVNDGLLPLPNDYDVSTPNWHMQLARDPGFRSFVLRSCSIMLEGAQSAAAAAALLQVQAVTAAKGSVNGIGSSSSNSNSHSSNAVVTAPAAEEVLVLGPALFQVAKLIMYTAGVSNSDSTGTGSGEGNESLEQLSATALLQLLKLADVTQQLAALFKLIPLEDGSLIIEQPADVDAAAAIAQAVVPRLPQLEACTDKLMQKGYFKEAQICVECLVLLGRQLSISASSHQAADAQEEQQQQQQQQRQKRQQQQPASAELSRWAFETALQQEEPEVKSVSLAKALLDVYIRFHATDDLSALKTTVQEIQTLVGDCETDTQATQRQPRRLRMLLGDRTAQPCASAALAYIDESLGQLERLVGGNLKAGFMQDSDSAEQARDRRRLAGGICKRLQGLLECLAILVNTIIGMPPVIDHQVRVLTRAYKLLGMLAKAHQIPKSATHKQLPPEFELLVSMVNRELTHRVYHFLNDDQEAQQADISKVKLARVKREAKQVPQLVFNIEAWEKELVATGKAAGGKNLLKDAKRASIRDFRIRPREDGDAAYDAAAATSGRGLPRTTQGGGSGVARGGATARSGGSSSSGGGSNSARHRQHDESTVTADGGEVLDQDVNVDHAEDEDADQE